MAFREVTVIETKEVLRLWRSGVAKKRIAAQLGVDVKTVRGYAKVAERLELDRGLDLDIATAAVVERLAAANRRPRGATWEVCVAHGRPLCWTAEQNRLPIRRAGRREGRLWPRDPEGKALATRSTLKPIRSQRPRLHPLDPLMV